MEFFFDIPWYVPAALIGIGIGLFLWANARMRRRERAAGVGLIILALLLTLVSYLVDTPAETVAKRTRSFVHAVVARDRATMDSLLSPQASAFNWGKEDIINGAVYYAEETALSGARILRLEVNKEGHDLVSYLTVWSQHAGNSALPVTDLNSQWKLEWTEDKLQILEIVPVQIGQTAGEDVERRYLERPVKPRR